MQVCISCMGSLIRNEPAPFPNWTKDYTRATKCNVPNTCNNQSCLHTVVIIGSGPWLPDPSLYPYPVHVRLVHLLADKYQSTCIEVLIHTCKQTGNESFYLWCTIRLIFKWFLCMSNGDLGRFVDYIGSATFISISILFISAY